ncbi:MAG: hypothetical protein K2X82_08305 [Gemmataceae bacterium]|nr:hypothetical protein [Gemmataceae bacterium]
MVMPNKPNPKDGPCPCLLCEVERTLEEWAGKPLDTLAEMLTVKNPDLSPVTKDTVLDSLLAAVLRPAVLKADKLGSVPEGSLAEVIRMLYERPPDSAAAEKPLFKPGDVVQLRGIAGPSMVVNEYVPADETDPAMVETVWMTGPDDDDLKVGSFHPAALSLV